MGKKTRDNIPGSIWHIDVIPMLEQFPREIQARLLMGSLYYRRDGIEPDFSDNPVADMFWNMYRLRLDYDESGYYDQATNGKLGGMYRAYKEECKKNKETPMGFALWKETIGIKDDEPSNQLEPP